MTLLKEHRHSLTAASEVSSTFAGQIPSVKTTYGKRPIFSWIGEHIPPNGITRQALRWNPQRKCKRGHPKNTWLHDLEANPWRYIFGSSYPDRVQSVLATLYKVMHIIVHVFILIMFFYYVTFTFLLVNGILS